MRSISIPIGVGLLLAAVAPGVVAAGAKAAPQAIPLDDDQALVYHVASNVTLTFETTNPFRGDVRLVVSAADFKGEPVSEADRARLEAAGETVVAYGVRRFFRIVTLPDRTAARKECVLRAGSKARVRVNLGKLRPGFRILEVSLFEGARRLSTRRYPLAVVEGAAPARFAPPTFPIGVYTRLMQYRRTTQPLFWKTYLHAIAHDLRKHNLNAVVACGGFDQGEVEIWNAHGIAGITRGEKWLDHPGVIASLVGDEPHPGEELERLKEQYARLRARTKKPFTTCMVGEPMGLGTPQDPVNLWKALQPPLRVFRWYGVKKHFYDALHPLRYKGVLPFSSVLRIAEASGETPWWVVLPAFGKTHHEAYFQNPSPAQLKALVHLACAYGADGILFFQYQDGLVDPVTLRPRDEKFAAVAEVAGKIAAHGRLIASLEHAGLDIRCPSPLVEAVPLASRSDGKLYVYAVNKDSQRPAKSRLLLWAETWTLSEVRDVYGGKNLPVERDDEGYLTVPVVLPPGEGQLLATNARQKK